MRAELPNKEQMLDGIRQSDRTALGRAITLVESNLESDQRFANELVKAALPFSGQSIRIAISGVPGVGKSSFIEVFGKYLTSLKKKVAVLAIDPTSSRSRGSILGDKTRMEELSKDPLAFVRPTSTGGHLGGVAGKTRETIVLCEAAGYNVILIETVGVGQSEITVEKMVDFVLLLMLAGAGDELQGIKKGIMEIADGVAITKADGDNIAHAKRAMGELNHAIHLTAKPQQPWIPKVLTCSAQIRTGFSEIWELMNSFRLQSENSGKWMERRNMQQISWVEESLKLMIDRAVANSEAFRNKITSLQSTKDNHSVFPPAVALELWKDLLKELGRD